MLFFFFIYEVSSFGLTGPLLVTLLLPLNPKARLAVLALSLPADLQRFLIALLVVQGLFNYADYDVNTNVLILICSELCPFGVLAPALGLSPVPGSLARGVDVLQ